MSEHLADAWMAMRAAELAEKRPVTLRFESAGLLMRLTLLRPALREVTRRLKPRGYVLTRRDRYSCTFTHKA
jgi:hypothetical protein